MKWNGVDHRFMRIVWLQLCHDDTIVRLSMKTNNDADRTIRGYVVSADWHRFGWIWADVRNRTDFVYILL
jgi:hypothetical protein